jgi:hypothetical protein
MIEWLTGKKAKEGAKEKAEYEIRKRESDALRKQKTLELWSRVLSLESYTEVSLNGFNQNSISALYDIVNEGWASRLSRDFKITYQEFHAYEDDEGQHYYVVFYKQSDVGRRTIDFGEPSDSLETVRGRFELVDRILQSGIRPEIEAKKSALLKILGD